MKGGKISFYAEAGSFWKRTLKGEFDMPREKELYRDTLERIRQVADQLYPGKVEYKNKEIAKILGCSVATLYRRGIKGRYTAEQLARLLS